MIQLKRILVPTDFSDHSQTALDYACLLASEFGARIDLLNVIENMTPLSGYVAEDEPQIREKLQGLPQESKQRDFVANRITKLGHPMAEIVRYAKAHDIDLIVMGTHGRTALAHVLMGSVAENVVRHASCPVLTVRNSDHSFVAA